MSSKREAADAALASTDWSGAVVHKTVTPPSIVHSARLSRPVTERLLAEAARRDIKPGTLIAQLVEAALDNLGDATVTVRVSDLHRAIDQIARQQVA